MEYRIDNMSGFKVLGKVEKEILGNVKANQFWKQSEEDGTLKTLTEYSTSPDKEYIGFADGSSCDGESYLYYTVTPYDGVEIPDGYCINEIPDHLWVKFRCRSLGYENTADCDIWSQIYSEFSPASEFEPGEYQMEVYPCGDGDYPDAISEIWIAVRPKAKT